MPQPLELAQPIRTRPLPTFAERLRLREAADWLVVAVAVSLPWSTSATAILIVLWLIAVLPTLDPASVGPELKTAAGGLPVLLWMIAAFGMLWTEVSWSERLSALEGFHKLLFVPLLLAQFRRSGRPDRAIVGFLTSALVLLIVSLALALTPGLPWRGQYSPGVPVKDYISQSGIFALCAFGLLGQAVDAWRVRRWQIALAFVCMAGLFIVDIAFVATGRTTLVVIAVLLVIFGFQQFGWKGLIGSSLIGMVLAGLLWVSSAYLRDRVTQAVGEFEIYRIYARGENSTGQRFEFWKISIELVAEAPLVGHGTGSTMAMFRRVTAGRASASWFVTDNPHNQFLAVAVELGLLGLVVLIAMWISHLLLFRDGTLNAWFGLVVVISNVVSSFFNSHLLNFTQGWIYVFGVGVLGGAALFQRDQHLRNGG